jgi:voltage-gated potassium channel
VRALGPLLSRSLSGRSLNPRRAARLIAATSLLLTVAGGVAVRLLDRKDFHSLGDALWWAVQTLTTVGYGDVVPAHTSGRIVGTILMLNGIALLTVVTASITATLVEQARQRRGVPDDAMGARLDRIEARLADLVPDGQRRGDGPED